MVAGLAADRNRRPPTALLLAEGLETIVRQMERGRRRRGRAAWPAPASRPRRRWSPTPAAQLAPATAPPAPARLAASTAPTPPSTIQPYPDYVPEAQPSYAGSLPPTYPPTPYAEPEARPAVATVAEQPKRPPRRSASYYLLLGLAALALFAISMFVTILLLQ